MVDRDHLAVYFRSDTSDSYIRMDLESEVERCTFGRQFNNVSARCEYKYLIIKQVDFYGIKEFYRVIGFLLPFKSLSEPCELLFTVVNTA